MYHYFILLSLILFIPGGSNRMIQSDKVAVPKAISKMKGINFVAPPRPFESDPMQEVVATGIDWVAVIPYGFTRLGQPEMIFSEHEGAQWWGEQPSGVRETIRLAKESGLKVMLKPQVWIPRSWPGDLDFETTADWESWESGYRRYILLYAEMAQELGVELFCVGTEFKIAAIEREAFWRGLIQEVREKYTGKVTYAANWDEYPTMPFWDALDYVGIDAYFPLSEESTPTVEHLLKSWSPLKKKMRQFAQEVKRPILFTEYGYLSVSGCAGKTWILEKNRQELEINEQAQANALEALYTSFWNEPYWHGGFIWKWYPYNSRRPGRREKDYTPQGKIAQEVMRTWFHQ